MKCPYATGQTFISTVINKERQLGNFIVSAVSCAVCKLYIGLRTRGPGGTTKDYHGGYTIVEITSI